MSRFARMGTYWSAVQNFHPQANIRREPVFYWTLRVVFIPSFFEQRMGVFKQNMIEIMIRTILGTVVLLGSNLVAQTWCPLSATWTYSFENFTSTGYTRFTCVGDTIIAEVECQKVEREVHYYDFISSTYVSGTGPRYCTRDVAGLVPLWDGAAFDTLYNFNAAVGSSWRLPNDGSYPTDRTVNVVGAGVSEVNGIPLQWLKVTLDGVPMDTVFERMGGLGFYWLPWEMNIPDGFAGPLRCYEDLEFQYSADPTAPCDLILGLLGQRATQALLIGPNPGKDQCTITGLGTTSRTSIVFRDMQGKIISTFFVNGDQLLFNADDFNAGIYWIEATNANIGHSNSKWIKQ